MGVGTSRKFPSGPVRAPASRERDVFEDADH